MTDDRPTFDDLALLASCRLDGPLDPAGDDALRTALSESSALREEADQLERVDGLVRRWGATEPKIDEVHFARLVSAQVIGEEVGLDAVDQVLASWSAIESQDGDNEFVAAVMKRVKSTVAARSTHRSRRILRFALPLAAAAVLVFAVTGTSWFLSSTRPVCQVTFGVPAGSLGAQTAENDPPTIVVRFSQASPGSNERPSGHRSISFISLGTAGEVGS